MRRICLPLLLFALCACARVGEKRLAEDIRATYPGCTLERLVSVGNLHSSDQQVIVRFSYRCPGIEPKLHGAFVYEKAMNTGFASYCCAREAVADDYR